MCLRDEAPKCSRVCRMRQVAGVRYTPGHFVLFLGNCLPIITSVHLADIRCYVTDSNIRVEMTAEVG